MSLHDTHIVNKLVASKRGSLFTYTITPLLYSQRKGWINF